MTLLGLTRTAMATATADTAAQPSAPISPDDFGAPGAHKRPIFPPSIQRHSEQSDRSAGHTALADPGATNPTLPALTARQRVACVTAPMAALGAALPVQDTSWRAHATQMARDHDLTCAATWLGFSLRGADSYAVTVARLGARLIYRVSFIPTPAVAATATSDLTIDDGRYLCECASARRGLPCAHAGAAYLLANRRAIVRESIALAQMERLSWAWATPQGALDDSAAGGAGHRTDLYRVARGQGRFWGYVRVFWDRRNAVALWCDCGAPTGCAHIGSVAQRAERERREYLTRCQQTWR